MDHLKAAVYQAIGEASMCWENPEGAGVFDAEAADRVASALLDEIRELTLYTYKARVSRIVDGDTIDVDIDLGFGMTSFQRLRFARINAPEVRGEEKEAGQVAKGVVDEKIPPGSEIMIHTEKDDSFGRYIAEIWYGDGVNLNEEMVSLGHAVFKEY